MFGKFDNIKIQGISAAVPSYIEENLEFKHILGERRTKKQIKMTGVSKRHVCGKYQRTSDLCYAAAVKLLKKLKWNKEEIKVMVFITQGPNYELPSTAFFLHKRLGLNKDCIVFDVNLGCSGFPVGVQIVSSLLQQYSVGGKGLLLLGDTASKVLQSEAELEVSSITSRMLFGGAGSATALEVVEHNELLFMNMSDGNGFEAIIKRFKRPTFMDGSAVFQFSITEVTDGVNNFKKQFNISDKDIDYYVFHQAQKLILDNIADICGLPDEKVLRSLDEYGNTSGASVPLTVCSNLEKIKNKEKVKLFLCGFGVGLSWGNIYTEIDSECILPVFETDEHYDEDKKQDNGLRDKKILVFGAGSELGEFLSRELNEKSATVILVDSDEKKLKNIQESMFEKSYVIVNDLKTKENIMAVFEQCKEKQMELDGIVLAKELTADNISIFEEILNLLNEDAYTNEYAVVIGLSSIEDLRMTGDYEKYYEEKAKFNKLIDSQFEKIRSKKLRVNIILHEKEKLNIVQKNGEGREWFKKYIEEGKPENMEKLNYIADSIGYLISDNSKYTSGALIPITSLE